MKANLLQQEQKKYKQMQTGYWNTCACLFSACPFVPSFFFFINAAFRCFGVGLSPKYTLNMQDKQISILRRGHCWELNLAMQCRHES